MEHSAGVTGAPLGGPGRLNGECRDLGLHDGGLVISTSAKRGSAAFLPVVVRGAIA